MEFQNDGQLILFLTTIAGFAIQLFREWRNRKWDLEDRERARKELAEKVESAQTLAISKQKEMLDKIEENTNISREAFTEANGVNQKLLLLQNQLNEPYDRKAAGIRQRQTDMIEKTHDTVEETKDIVEKIERKL
jgi:hypothetical protein